MTDQAEALRTVAEEYWQQRLQASPLFASLFGYHRFDDRADEMSVQAEQRRRATWAQLRERVGGIDVGSLNETEKATHALLAGELDDTIRGIDLRLVELASDQMQGVHADLLMLAGQLRVPDPEHAEMAVRRIGELARMLDEAAQRYKDGAAAGRTPAKINVTRSMHQIDGYLGSSLDDDPFVNLAGPEDWDGLDAWRSQLADAVRTELRPAYERYREVFANDLEPVARPDEKPGLAYLDDGEEIYQALIEMHTGLPLSADELHSIGLEEATQVIRAEFAEVGSRVFGTSDVREIFDRLLNDSDLRYENRDELLQHAQGCLETAESAMSSWFGILPKAPCVLEPVPDYLAADVPPAYYMPPAPDGSKPGTYFVNLHEATERGRYSTASIAYHESIPGHHLQLAIASERSDLPEFRRLAFGQTAFVEGWALYTERLAGEMGLYENDLDRLGMLSSDAWRACRLVVDTGLHSRGWSRQQAIDFMVENMPVDVETITTEVDRYIGMPGQALAYKVGQREILKLRDQARYQLGDRFDIKDFHDAVLGGATISLPVLRDRVAAYIAG